MRFESQITSSGNRAKISSLFASQNAANKEVSTKLGLNNLLKSQLHNNSLSKETSSSISNPLSSYFSNKLDRVLYRSRSAEELKKVGHDLDSAIKFLKENGVNNLEVYEVTTEDGNPIKVLFAKAPKKENAYTKVYFHGNAGTEGAQAKHAVDHYKQGYNICLFSYRGFSTNPGKPTKDGLIKDGNAVLEDLIAKGIPTTKMDIHASSLGTAVALHTIARRSKEKNKGWMGQGPAPEKFHSVTLVSPFNSIIDMAKRELKIVPEFIVKWLLKDSPNLWDNSAAAHWLIADFVRVVHGSDDQVVPISQGRKLFEKIKETARPRQFLELKGKGHQGLGSEDDWYKLSGEDKPVIIPSPYGDANLLHVSGVTHSKEAGTEHAVDVSLDIGTPLYAVKNGVVEKIIQSHEDLDPSKHMKPGENDNNLNFIKIKNEDGTYQIFAHIKQNSVKLKVGDKLKVGQKVAESGHNGCSSQPHLHFQLSVEDPKKKMGHEDFDALRAVPVVFE